jgi:hypothetical protein
MTGRRRLTEAEAAAMTRSEIVDRVYEEMQAWKRRPPRTDAQRAAYDEMMRIMRAYVDPGAGLDAVRDVLKGRPNDYWETVASAGDARTLPARDGRQLPMTGRDRS